MLTRFPLTIALSSASLSFASNSPPKTREVSISLLEIDPKEVGSKARPERRRIIEAAMQMALTDRAPDLAKVGLRLTIEQNDIYQAPDSAAKAVTKSIEGKSIAAIGLPTSYYAEHGGIALQGSELTVISPFATSSKLVRFSKNLLLLMPPNNQSAKAFGQVVREELKARSVAIVVPWDNAFSQDFYTELPESLREKSTLIKVLDDQQNLDSVTRKITELKPDVVVLTSFPAFTGKLMRSIHEQGFRGVFVGPSSWGEGDGKPLHALTKDLPIRSMTLRETSEYFVTEAQQKFVARFNQTTGLTFSSEAGLYYDAANLVIDRVTSVGNQVSREKLTQALRSDPQRCGIFSNVCDSKKAAVPFYLVSYENGKFSPKKVIHLER